MQILFGGAQGGKCRSKRETVLQNTAKSAWCGEYTEG